MSNVKYMLPRFHAPDLERDASLVTLPADEARHITRVLRMKAGDEIAVFNGRGVEVEAVIDVAVRDTVTARIVRSIERPAAFPFDVTIVQAVLKGGSMDEAVRDATMMGVTTIVPVLGAHTDVKASVVQRGETVERWRRVALAAVKQSRRATLPDVLAPQTLDAWLRQAKSEQGVTSVMFVEPSLACEVRSLKSVMDQQVPQRMIVLLGPEGGWAATEVEAARAIGVTAVTLGPLTLRAESMPVAALAAIQALAR